ncbi:hypothetical protein JRQ81_008910 [Phrynocephalus forsythii]|uniref:Myb/SANT-like DNA-binding domain-containing protein n=1 Tax=Phrynocephalus forsythii TaxID=171643 RepID=A0A9Q0XAW1_9SAUR|nr:hypothetical protein JRQ81_008910 [Phrynocephalus forsythii]
MADSTGGEGVPGGFAGRAPSLAPKKGRGSSWQYQETAALLQLWGQAPVQEELRTSHRNRETFERIAEGMRRRGFPRGAAECRTKTKKLKGEYKQALRRLAGEGASRRDGDGGPGGKEEDQEARRWPFFRTLARILRHQDQEEPTPTLQGGETPGPQPSRMPGAKSH